MAKAPIEDIRNIALVGHGSAGKTTLADQILVNKGKASGNPSVDNGSSICDFDQEEKDRNCSIEASLIHFEHKGKRFNVLDTPGFPDYIGQAIGCLRAVDTAVVVVNAQSGIQVNTRRMFEEAGKAGLGRVVVLNKLDSDNLDFDQLIGGIKEMWGNQCVLLNVPVGIGADFKDVISTLNVPDDTTGALINPNDISEPLMESIIEVDEEVMERYFEGKRPTEEELSRLIVRAVAEGSLVPVLCCSSKTNVGVEALLDALAMCALSPKTLPQAAKKDGQEVELPADPAGPLCAQVFKTRIDPFVQKLSFIRVFNGTLKKDDNIHVSTSRKGVKMGPLLEVQADDTSPVDLATPGDIVAMAKMEELHTGAVLGDFELEPIKFPTPMVSLAVSPKSRGDETKLSGALHKVVEEDPTFLLDRDSATKELVMSGMSELHLLVIQERLKRRDKLEVETKEPRIAFRETIQANAEGMHRHKKQSGGRGQFGEVHIRMFPFPRGTDPAEFCTKARFASMKDYHYDEKHNFVWVDSVVGGTIPGNFLPAIEKGFKERLVGGVLAKCPVQDVCVEVHFGKHHPVDSSEAAFKSAGSKAFRDVFEKAKPAILEPIVKLSVTVPESAVGDIYSNMSSLGGQVQGSESAGGDFQTVHCQAPLRVVTNYARFLSSAASGEGSYTMDFSHYEVMPANVAQEVIAKAKSDEEEDDD